MIYGRSNVFEQSCGINFNFEPRADAGQRESDSFELFDLLGARPRSSAAEFILSAGLIISSRLSPPINVYRFQFV
jgi:hypothetical protein